MNFLAVGCIVLAAARGAAAQSGGGSPLVDANTAEAAPVTNMGGGDFFSQELGSLVRLRYSTESYGQDEHGNFDLGTLQITNFDDATAFFDGQVTLNEAQGIGFNLGLGYRWLADTPLAFEPERVTGVSLWADGTDAKDGNFFPQVGVSYESLGDMWDMRVNGYVPVGARRQTGHFNPTGVVGFSGNEIVDQTVANRHTSFDLAELEIARRLGNERDAWGFAGPYVLANDDDSSAGWKVGVRGYAYPDLMLQFDVSQDDIFHTNAAFSMVWYVGRTRSSYQPACGLPDRMRESVIRNDYVVLAKDVVHGGTPLTDAVSGQAFNVVHVASSAPAGGNGTFEHPLNDVAEVKNNSKPGTLNTTPVVPGSIILLHGGSVFDGATGGASGSLVLQDNQRLLGEGGGQNFFVNSTQHGPQTLIPETSPGARALTKPAIVNSKGDPVIKMADTNEVANLTIDGSNGTGAHLGIGPGDTPGHTGAGNPNIHDVTFQNTAGTGLAQGIFLTSFLRDNDTDTSTPGQTIAFNVNLSKLTFTNLTGDEITIDATLPMGVTLPDPNITNQEAMTIDNITSTGGGGRGLSIQHTHTGGTAAITNFTHTGGTGSTAMEFNDYAATANVSTSKLSGMGDGVAIDNGSTGSLTFASSLQFDTVNQLTGRSVHISGNTGGTATFLGDITAMPALGNNAIELAGNTGQTIDFLGNLKLTTPLGTGKAFTATGGGTLLVTGTDNELSTIDGTALEIRGMTLDTGGATFKKLSSGNATVGPVSGIILGGPLAADVNTGGPITVGDVTANAGDTGSIRNASGDAIIIQNTANATINGMKIDHPAVTGTSGVHVTKSTPTTTSTVNLGNMEIDGGATGIQVTGGGTTGGTLTMTVNDTNIKGPTGKGIQIGDTADATKGVDHGTITFNNTKVDGNNVTASTGVEIGNSNANITFDSASTIQNLTGAAKAFEVNGGTTGTITYNGTITTTSLNPSQDLEVQNRTGGSVTFSPTSTISDTGGKGVSIHNNTGGSVLLQGTNTLAPAGVPAAVSIANNTGASITLAGLKITAIGAENGLDASGGGTLEVDGATNTIDAVNGKGLSIVGMTIANAGVNFQTINVTAGATNGIVLQNLTGGQVTIGSSTGAANSGGMLMAAAEAVLITDAQNVDLNHLHVLAGATQGVSLTQNTSATTLMDVTLNDLLVDATAGGNGVVALANSTNAFNVRLENSTVNDNVLLTGTGSGTFGLLVDKSTVTTGDNTTAFDIELSGASRLANLVIRNGSTFTTNDANALLVNSSGPTAKTVNLLLDGTSTPDTFTNTSATNVAANFVSGGTTTLNATIQGNLFDNASTPAKDFKMATAAATSRVLLNLGGTTGTEPNTAVGGGTFTLDNTAAGVFTIFNKTATLAGTMNSGTVTPVPNAAAFLDTATPPVPPSAP